MTTYTVIPQDDLNLEVTVLDPAVTPTLQDDSDLDVVVQEADNPVIINITPAAVNVTSAVLSVNGFTGIVELTSTDIPEGTNLYYTDLRVDNYLQSGGVTSIDFENATQLSWNADDGTLEFPVNGEVTLQIGQENLIHVKNSSGVNLTNGTVVAVTGSSGSKLTVTIADYTDEQLSSATIAVMTQDLNNNAVGYATTEGLVRGLDTTAFAEGDTLYLDGNGTIVNTKPATPLHLVQVGWVVRSHPTEGSIFVYVKNGWELEELHDVLITNVADNQLIAWDATNDYWRNITNDYATTSYVDTADAGVLSDANSYTDGVAVTTLASANSYTDSQGFITANSTDTLTNKSGNISQWTNDAGYLTSETDNQTLSFSNPNLSISNGNTVDLSGLTPDLTGYATEAWVSALPVSTFTNDSGYITSSALTPYYTSAQVDALPVSTFTNDSGYITISALTPYYTSAQVDALPVSTFTNDAGYLTTETDSQTLSLVNNTLSISNGNSVDLGSVAPDETDGGTF